MNKLIVLSVFILCACTPDAPPTGADSKASIRFDENHQDAGIGDWTVHGFPASQQYHANYMLWLPKYGVSARAPQDPFAANPAGGHYPWYVTAGGAQAYEEMSRNSK